MTRSAIPDALKRKLFVEAGHRCSIPSCKNTPLDIHHIEPWASVQCHEFKNLIVLCPNCHRRFHTGEIDKQSIIAYKERLSNLYSSLHGDVDGRSTPGVEYKKLSETVENSFTFECIFPKLCGTDTPDYYILNLLFEANAYKSLIGERSREHFASGESLDELLINSQVTLNTPKILAIREASSVYFSGAAHGIFGISGKHYALNPVRKILLPEEFINSSEGLNIIHKYCRDTLNEECPQYADFVKTGCTEDWTTFDNHLITECGIEFLFNPYEAGPYSAGIRRVFMPFQLIKNKLSMSGNLISGLNGFGR